MTKKILFLLLINVFAVQFIRAQQITRFAYIQTDNKQPFYIKWNNKVWSSSSTGYLILSKIKDQQINIVIGFPKNLFPEQAFTVMFNGNKDAGYLLKDFGEKGWGLYNLQTMMVVYAAKETPSVAKEEANPVANPPKVEEAKSPFGDLLVQVTQDSTVRNIAVEKPQPPPVVKKEEPAKPVVDTIKKVVKQDEKPSVTESKKEMKPETKTTAAVDSKKADSVRTNTATDEKQIVKEPAKEEKTIEKVIVPMEEKKADSVKTEPPVSVNVVKQEPVNKPVQEVQVAKSTVNLFAVNESASGYDYIYVTDDKTGVKDTITISIAKEKAEIKPVIKQEVEVKDTIIKQPKEQPKFIDIIPDSNKVVTQPVIEIIKKDSVVKSLDTVKKEPVVETSKTEQPVTQIKEETGLPKESVKDAAKEPSKAVMVNTDCKNMATEKDFMALRKKMVAEENDDDMVSAARKVFKSKCFTTDQVKNLCVLFLKDEGKYKFLDAAYPYVYDTDKFKQLSSLLTEEYYISRFKVMIKN